MALADPDATGRDKTAAAIGTPRRYADFREMFEKEVTALGRWKW